MADRLPRISVGPKLLAGHRPRHAIPADRRAPGPSAREVERLRRHLPAAVGLAAAVTAGILIARPSHLSPRLSVSLGIVTMAVACLSPIALLRGTRSGVGTGPLYAFMMFVTFVPGALPWLGHPTNAPAGLDQTWIAGALLLVSLGMGAFWLGYLLALGPRRDDHVIAPRRLVPVSVLLLVFAGGAAIDLFLFRIGDFGYVHNAAAIEQYASWVQWAETLSGLTDIALIVAAIHGFGSDSLPHRRLTTLLLPVAMGLGLLSGFKSQVLWPAALVFFVYVYYRRRVPWRPLAAVTLLMMVVIPANLAYRERVRPTSGIASSGLAGAVHDARQTLAASIDTPLAERQQLLNSWATQRLGDINSVALILRLTPNPNPYLHGRLYAEGPLLVIVPRFLWPSKPILNAGYLFGQNYLGIPSSIQVAIPITQPGDLYMNFGVAGVLIGMLVWGVLCARAQAWFLRQSGAAALVVFVVFLSELMRTEVDFVSLFATAFRDLVLATLVALMLFGTSGIRRARGGPAPDAILDEWTLPGS